jgi:hypothetical protein
MEHRNRFQGMNFASLYSLAGRYDNPIPTRLLVPIDCLKIPAQGSNTQRENIWYGKVDGKDWQRMTFSYKSTC